MKIRFWNDEKIAFEKYPIVEAKKLVPSWFKNLPQTVEYYNNHSTIKTCPGIIKYLTTGFILRTWIDTVIETTDTKINFIYPNGTPHSDYLSIMESMFFDENQKKYDKYRKPHVLKWYTRWMCQPPSGYDIVYLPAQYHFNLNFTTIMGLLDTRLNEHLNVQVAWHPQETSTFIPAGTPIAQFIFLKRDTLEYEVCEASQIDRARTRLKEKRMQMKKHCSFFDEKYFDYTIDEQLSND